MRDPERIPELVALLEHYWYQYPDLRLGQILGNCARYFENDPYYIEDHQLSAYLKASIC